MEYLTPHNLQIFSVVLEIIIAVLSLMVARRGWTYMYGMAVAFGIYGYNHAALLWGLPLPASYLPLLYVIAALGAVYCVWSVYRRT